MGDYINKASHWASRLKVKVDEDVLYIQRNGLKGLLRNAGHSLKTTTVNTVTYVHSRGIINIAKDAHQTVTTTAQRATSTAYRAADTVTQTANSVKTTVTETATTVSAKAQMAKRTVVQTANTISDTVADIADTVTDAYIATTTYLQPVYHLNMLLELAHLHDYRIPAPHPADPLPPPIPRLPRRLRNPAPPIISSEADPIGIVPAHIQSHENSSDDETQKPDLPVDQGWEDVQWKEALAAEPDETLRREQEREFRRLRRDREDDVDLLAYFAELDKGNVGAVAPAVAGGGISRVGDMEDEMDEDEEEGGDLEEEDGEGEEGISGPALDCGSKNSVVGSEQVGTGRAAEEEKLVDAEMTREAEQRAILEDFLQIAEDSDPQDFVDQLAAFGSGAFGTRK